MMYNHAEKKSDGKEVENDTLPALYETGKVYPERPGDGFDLLCRAITAYTAGGMIVSVTKLKTKG